MNESAVSIMVFLLLALLLSVRLIGLLLLPADSRINKPLRANPVMLTLGAAATVVMLLFYAAHLDFVSSVHQFGRTAAETSSVGRPETPNPEAFDGRLPHTRWNTGFLIRSDVHTSIAAASRDLAARLRDTFASAPTEPKRIVIRSVGDQWPGRHSEVAAAEAALAKAMPAVERVEPGTPKFEDAWVLKIDLDADPERDATLTWLGERPDFGGAVTLVDKPWVERGDAGGHSHVIGRATGDTDDGTLETEALRDAAEQMLKKLGSVPVQQGSGDNIDNETAIRTLMLQIRIEGLVRDRFEQPLETEVGGLPIRRKRLALLVAAGQSELARARSFLEAEGNLQRFQRGLERRGRRNTWVALGLITLVITGLYVITNHITRDFYRGRLQTAALLALIIAGVVTLGTML